MKKRPVAFPNKAIRYWWMQVFFMASLFLVIAPGHSDAQTPDATIEGRWDMTVQMSDREAPSWLEIVHSGRNHLVGSFVADGGSARPIARINFSDGKMSFSIPPQWEQDNNELIFEALLQGDSLIGTMVAANGKKYNWTAHRAPKLKRTAPVVWGKPISLFNGKNLEGWHASGENQWKAVGGVLTSARSGSNLISDKVFTDFKLHVEFRYPKGSNSGVYLRGRYEVQVEDSKGREPQKDLLGGVYGFIAPTEMMAKAAGEWQSFDITLTGRMITLMVNGKTVICNQEIPGITGGALNSREAEPGPIMFQGDHGPIEYRNIVITPAK
jgi:Domain of Unknown Function (DUF1080)